MGQVGKAGAVGGAPNTVTHGEPRRTLTDAQDDQRLEGFTDAGALRVDGATVGPENSAAQGMPRRMNANNVMPTSHGQSNSIAVHPTQFDGFQASEVPMNPNNKGAHYSSISPSRGGRQVYQQPQPRGPNPLDGAGGMGPAGNNAYHAPGASN